MAKEIVNRSVSFNVADPYQRKLYSHTTQFTNFSSYIKTLIQRDMEGVYQQNRAPITNELDDKELLNGLI